MAEYDAFGRKLGEDPLEGIGGGGETAPAEPVASPTPTLASSPPTSAREAPGPAAPDLVLSGVRAQALARRFVGIVVLAVLVALVGGAVLAVKNGLDAVPDFKVTVPGITLPSLPSPVEQPAAQAPAKAPKPAAGLQRGSLIRRAEFGQAISRLRGRRLGRVTHLRVAADRLNVQLLTAGGRLRKVQVDPGPAVREISLSGPGFGHIQALSYGAINLAAPARLAREAAHRRGVATTSVDYLVVSRFADEIVWSLFFKNGGHYLGDASGHFQRHL